MFDKGVALSERWQHYFADIAISVSKGSKDPSTKHGAVVYRPDLSIACTGFNGLPRRIPDDPVKLLDREWKLKRIIHAEANALDHKKECLHGYGMVVTGSPCVPCALKIVNSGISFLYHFPLHKDFEERWRAETDEAKDLLREGGICVHEIPYPFSVNV